MSFWRLHLISILILAPILTLVVAGGIALWQTGHYFVLWWLFPVCWLPAWLLARRWRKQFVAPDVIGQPPGDYWTERDKQAWVLVQAAQDQAAAIPAERFTDPQFHLQSAMDLGLRIAQVYRPKAKNPYGSRTLVEILAVAQLALEESERRIADYVPGSHLLTIDQWRLLSKAPRWWRLASNVGWAASIAFNPINVTRLVASKLALGSVTKQLQENTLAWAYAVYIGRVGFYLIEMNSGRLRSGTRRYKQLTRPAGRSDGPAPGSTASEPVESPDGAAGPCEVVVAVVGQVNAGKSSLINALLGQRTAETDVLPATRDVRRYRLHQPDQHDSHWTLLDTPGYGEDGASDRQKRAIQIALNEADLILLVMKVTSPARQADSAVLEHLNAVQRRRPDRKPVPVLGVLTHIDQLSPVMEWSPPYNWETPTVRKEEQIQEAVQYHRQLLGSALAGIVPVCSDVENQREFGVVPWLLPAMLQLLGEARGCAVLRILGQEGRSGQVRRVFGQLAQIGGALLQTALLPGEHRRNRP
jgi:uncharacterized protein